MSEVLARECALLHRYLVGGEPDDFVRAKYVAAHEPGRHGPVSPAAPDDALVRFARQGPAFVRLADAYGAAFQRGGALRRKLILLVAILESYGPTSSGVDSPDRGSRSGFWLGAGFAGIRFVLVLAVAVLAFVPWRLFAGRGS